MKKWFFLFVLGVLCAPFFAFSEEKTIIGEVIDVSCYVAQGAKGMEHKQCAIACLTAGEPAGILEDKTGKIYLVVTEDHKTNPRDKVMPFVAKMVEVTGDVNERSGVSTIDIKDIREKTMNEMPMNEGGKTMPKKSMAH